MKIKHNGILREMTEQEIVEYEKETTISSQDMIEILKQNLADTDYKAIKFAEGLISEDDYAEIRTQRQLWRDKINLLESEAQ